MDGARGDKSSEPWGKGRPARVAPGEGPGRAAGGAEPDRHLLVSPPTRRMEVRPAAVRTPGRAG